MSQDFIDLDTFNKRIGEPLRLYEQALIIWNRAGLNYAALSAEAKDVSVALLRQSIDLLSSLQKESLAQTQWSFVEAYILLTNAQILFIRSSCEDMATLEGLQAKYSLLEENIADREKAYSIFVDIGTVSDYFLNALRFSFLGDKAMGFMLLARILGRNGDVEGALDAYKQSEQLYEALLKLYEAENPVLIEIRNKLNQRIENEIRKIDGKDIDHISVEGYAIRFGDDFGELDNLDVYRRTWANYFSVKSSQNLIEAQNLSTKRDSPQVVIEKIDNAISYIYSGMEFFPDQLDFHQDLFNAYHMKGFLFGCPVPRRANYYYWKCPLAIMRFVGHWYLSAGIRYRELICNVCGKDILECAHFPGQEIDGVTVVYKREGYILEEISIVDIPRDPKCRISGIKLPVTFFDGMTPKGKAQLDDGELICHLCDVEPSDLEKFPLIIDLDAESANKARKKYMTILGLDLPRE
jgi:tetratricopeptide (TPR) repeat protein